MKIIITILILAFCSGCASIQRIEDWHKTVDEIASSTYIIGINDCLDKAQQFQNKHGGLILNVALKSGSHHALNDKVDKYGVRWVLDCSSGDQYMTTNIDRTVWMKFGGKIVEYNYIE